MDGKEDPRIVSKTRLLGLLCAGLAAVLLVSSSFRHLSFIKAILKTIAPEYRGAVRDLYYRPIAHALTAGHGTAIRGGPFAGMLYVKASVGSRYWPKVLGSYEEELHPVIEYVIAEEFARVINIGCGEGYYAVGIAMRLPHAHVYAFDIDSSGRRLCAELARINGVGERVSVEAECTPGRLNELMTEPVLLIADCEGCEMTLLDPVVAPGLSSATLLVELHDFIDPHISMSLLARFIGTHDITLITSRRRDPSDYPILHGLTRKQQWLVVDEVRPEKMQWAFMTPKC